MDRLGTLDEKLLRKNLRMISTRTGDGNHFIRCFEREVVTNQMRVEKAIGASLVDGKHAEASDGESFGRIAVEDLELV
jgi:hypothetical protein